MGLEAFEFLDGEDVIMRAEVMADYEWAKGKLGAEHPALPAFIQALAIERLRFSIKAFAEFLDDREE
jgi:hypothetical protein